MSWAGTLMIDLFGIFLALTAIIITYFKWSFTYWKKRNVPYLEPTFPFGNVQNPSKPTATVGLVIKNMYDELKKRNFRHGGVYFFTRPTYIVTDLEYVKNILTKDFQHFVSRGVYCNEEVDPLSAHLFSISGQKWRNLRVKLTPTFTSGKMKMMFQTLLDCEENLQAKLGSLCERKEAIDIKDLLGCYTTDVIGSCAFGLDCNTFKDDDSLFRKYGKMVFTPSTYERARFQFVINFPKLAKLLKMRVTTKVVADFFTKVVEDNVEYREKNNYTRKDFMQMLIDLKNNKLAAEEGYQHDGNTLTIQEVAAQSFIFFLAGFETSSTTMAWALYELAKNQDIQEKLRDEIITVLKQHDGKVTYDAIQDMKYMNQVLDETLRKYPPVPFLTRQCVKDYKIPDQDVILEEGTRVMISVLGIHRDKDHYPNPEKFDPERFNEENSKSRHQYAHIPFGEGPRICIGLRFGLMQSKVGLTSLLQKYRFTLNKKTKQPMKFSINSFMLAADGDIWLDAEKI